MYQNLCLAFSFNGKLFGIFLLEIRFNYSEKHLPGPGAVPTVDVFPESFGEAGFLSKADSFIAIAEAHYCFKFWLQRRL